MAQAPAAGGAPQTTFRDLLTEQATALGIPVDLALAMVQQESGGRADAESSAGAQGFFQLMPETAAELGVDPMDPAQNITGGLRYFKQQLDAHDGDVRLALAAYNAGPGAVTEAGGLVPDFPETQDYVERVLEGWRGESSLPTPAPTQADELGTPRVPSSQPGLITRVGDTTERVSRLTPGGGPGALHMAVRGMVRAKPGESTSGAAGRQVVGAGKAMASAMDPRTFEGRINLFGLAGGLATGGTGFVAKTGVQQAVKAGVLPWIGRILRAPAGAAGLAGAAAKAEDLLGTAPANVNVLWEGVKQGVYEAGGRLFMFPFRRGGAMSQARNVADPAREALEAGVAAAERTGAADIAAAQRATEGVSATMRMLKEAETIASRERAAQGTQVAVGVASRAGAPRAAVALERVVASELDAAGQVMQLTRQYDNLLSTTPHLLETGANVAATMRGPAQRALDVAGQRVADAAVGGPDGVITGKLRRNRPGVLISTVDTRADLYDSTVVWRHHAMRGVFHSGTLVRDKRSRERRKL